MDHSETTAAVASAVRQFCTFRLCGRLYGVDILDVKEINPDVRITPIFHAPNRVKGYVNIRGQLHLVLDLRRLLGFEPAELSATSTMVLFKPSVGEAFGVLVDAVGDVVSVAEDAIDDRCAEDGAGQGAALTRGVCRHGEDLLVMLDAHAFLAAAGEQWSE